MQVVLFELPPRAVATRPALYRRGQQVRLVDREPAPYAGTVATVRYRWWDERRGWCYRLVCFNGVETDAQENLHIAGASEQGINE